MITRIASVPVFVSDQNRALEFYRDKLGFKVSSDVPLGGDIRWITVAPQGGEDNTEFILFHPSISGENADEVWKRVGVWTGIVLLADDIQATYRELNDRGVEFEAEPKPQQWGGWETWFSDPDRNRFHLVQR